MNLVEQLRETATRLRSGAKIAWKKPERQGRNASERKAAVPGEAVRGSLGEAMRRCRAVMSAGGRR